MACPRCGTDCNCACSGDPLPNDWRREVSMQVRAHRARRRKIDPNAPQLDFHDHDLTEANETSVPAMRARNSRWDQDLLRSASSTIAPVEEAAVAEAQENWHETQSSYQSAAEHIEAMPQERLPLAPFPRIATQVRKVIQFPRNQVVSRQYELAEAVSDQLRIFEVEELPLPPPPPTHLAEIEIAAEEPTHATASDLDLPLQTAPLSRRAYAAAVDGVLLAAALGIFAECAKFFAGAFVLNKSLVANGSVCVFLLLGCYFFLSLSCARSTIGMRATGLRLSTFSGHSPSRNLLRWRALAIVLCYATLGLGLAWAFIDEDRLCWHDRITRTHLRRVDKQ